jgi:hypothetical protein
MAIMIPGMPGSLLAAAAAEEEEGGSALALISAQVTTSQSTTFSPTNGINAGNAIILIRMGLTGGATIDGEDYDPSGFTLFNSELAGDNDIYGRLLYRNATADDETINLNPADPTASVRTWIYVFSGSATVPIGDFDDAEADSQTATFDAMTMTNSRSFVIGAVQVRLETGDETPGLVSGTPTVTYVGSGTGYRGFYLGPAASFSARTCTIESSPPGKKWLTMVAEIVSAV